MLKKILSWSAVLIWMFIIYAFSAQSAEESSRLSRGLSRYLYNFINRAIPKQLSMQSFNQFLRSGAHFFIFFVLTLLLINAFRVSGYSDYKVLLYTIIIAIIYAAADEFHQLFVPGRTADIKDIFVDGFGIIFGMILYQILLIFNY